VPIERFTASGPLALLPLPDAEEARHRMPPWCGPCRRRRPGVCEQCRRRVCPRRWTAAFGHRLGRLHARRQPAQLSAGADRGGGTGAPRHGGARQRGARAAPGGRAGFQPRTARCAALASSLGRPCATRERMLVILRVLERYAEDAAARPGSDHCRQRWPAAPVYGQRPGAVAGARPGAGRDGPDARGCGASLCARRRAWRRWRLRMAEPTLQSVLPVDVVIVGGGIAGLATAAALSRAWQNPGGSRGPRAACVVRAGRRRSCGRFLGRLPGRSRGL
jgi:hypothetical protein